MFAVPELASAAPQQRVPNGDIGDCLFVRFIEAVASKRYKCLLARRGESLRRGTRSRPHACRPYAIGPRRNSSCKLNWN